jgi:type II secretory pathway pseudopilin PulG
MRRPRTRPRAAACRPTAHGREGFVLVAALLAIVLIGALAVGVMFATTEDTRAGSSAVARDIALMAAESAIAMAITNRTTVLPGLIGPSGTMSHQVEGSGPSVIVYITRLDSAMYWIVADATPDGVHSGARRRIGIIVTAVESGDRAITLDPVFERAWSELF